MIYSLEGKIIKIEKNFIVLNVNGIGYKIFTGSFSLELKNNQNLFLYTHQVVRETVLDLFGFKTETELKLFELLISISGIGPKVALGILSVTTPASLKRAVISENTDELTKVSGIGPRVAKKIILELGNKIEKIKLSDSEKNKNLDLETYETLEALGFDRTQIRNVLQKITETDSGKKIKQALKILGEK